MIRCSASRDAVRGEPLPPTELANPRKRGDAKTRAYPHPGGHGRRSAEVRTSVLETTPPARDLDALVTPGETGPLARATADGVPLSPPPHPASAVEEIAADELRGRWLRADATAPVVTYVAALPVPGKRARSAPRVPGGARSPASPPHRPAAPAPRRSVKQTVAWLWACVRRGGGWRTLLLAVPAMLLLVAGAFALGAHYGAGAPAALAAATPPAAATLPVAPSAPTPIATAVAVASPPAATSAAPVSATAAPVRVAVRLSCIGDSTALGLALDLTTAELIAVGTNRCHGWHLVQADTVVSWVPSDALSPQDTTAATTPDGVR